MYVNGKLVKNNAWTKTNKTLAPIDIIGGTGFTGLIDEVKVYPEGVASFFGVYFKEVDGTLVETEENKMFGTGTVLNNTAGPGYSGCIPNYSNCDVQCKPC